MLARQSGLTHSELHHISGPHYNDGLQIADHSGLEAIHRYELYGAEKAYTSENPSQNKNSTPSLTIWVVGVTVAFIIGGGMGGGIATSVMSNQKKTSMAPTSCPEVITSAPMTVWSTTTQNSITNAPTQTITASGPTQTITVGPAGCPLTNGTTYTSHASSNNDTYQIFCDRDITSGVWIKSPNNPHYASAMDDCLDFCSAYNENSTAIAEFGPCVGAGWILESPEFMNKNGLCFLKNESTLVLTDGIENIVAGVLVV